MSVVLDHPAYLAMEDSFRYTTLIHDFSEFNTTIAGEATVVAKTPLEHLNVALVEWVNSYVAGTDVHPLMSSYALDAAQLIAAHAHGEDKSSADLHWEVEAMVDFRPRYVQSFFDRDIKKGITARIQGLLVRVQVPPSARFTPFNTQLEQKLEGPCEVHAALHRCHLSGSVDHSRDLILVDAQRPTLDLMDSFRFAAELVPIEQVEALLSGATPSYRPQRLDLPGGWIRACFDLDSMQWEPVPAWAGADAPKQP